MRHGHCRFDGIKSGCETVKFEGRQNTPTCSSRSKPSQYATATCSRVLLSSSQKHIDAEISTPSFTKKHIHLLLCVTFLLPREHEYGKMNASLPKFPHWYDVDRRFLAVRTIGGWKNIRFSPKISIRPCLSRKPRYFLDSKSNPSVESLTRNSVPTWRHYIDERGHRY